MKIRDVVVSKDVRKNLLLVFFAIASLAIASPNAPAAAGPDGERRGPIAVVEETVYDFGVIAPQQLSEHVFLIRNEGEARLTIDKVVASCKCILPEDVAEGVDPGETAEIRVGFKGKPTQERYAQSVTIKTNDPANPRILLRIVGKIAPDVVVYPEALIMPQLPRGQEATGRFDVFTTVWDDFVIEKATCSEPSVKIDFRPSTAGFVEQSQALKSWECHASFTPPEQAGPFEYQVYLTVRPTDPAGEPRTLKVPVVGEIRGRIAVFGKGIDTFGRCDLGAVVPSAGVTRKLIVKVQDEQTELRLLKTETHPGYLMASLDSMRDSGKARLYRLTLEVPPGRLDSAYTGPRAGRVRFEFDHPRIKDLELQVEMLPSAPR